jgi:hypothetical protein
MRALAFVTVLASACAAKGPQPPERPANVPVASVEETTPRSEASPRKALGAAWTIDDHVGLHVVPREKALASLSTYDEKKVLRLGRQGKDFEVVGTDRVAKWSPTTEKTTFDPKAYAADALFVAAVSDVNAEIWVHVLLPVEDEREARDVMEKSRRSR